MQTNQTMKVITRIFKSVFMFLFNSKLNFVFKTKLVNLLSLTLFFPLGRLSQRATIRWGNLIKNNMWAFSKKNYSCSFLWYRFSPLSIIYRRWNLKHNIGLGDILYSFSHLWKRLLTLFRSLPLKLIPQLIAVLRMSGRRTLPPFLMKNAFSKEKPLNFALWGFLCRVTQAKGKIKWSSAKEISYLFNVKSIISVC